MDNRDIRRVINSKQDSLESTGNLSISSMADGQLSISKSSSELLSISKKNMVGYIKAICPLVAIK